MDANKIAELAKLAEIPTAGSEERLFWLEAAEQHGLDLINDEDRIYTATDDQILKLLSEARKQGQKDVLRAIDA